MNRLRVLFYAVNGLGLGHVSRLLAIAQALRQVRPEAECLFLTTSEADWVIFQAGFASFKVPSRTARTAAGLTPALYARTVHSVTWSLVTAFDPHVLVVDTFPAGTMQELLPLLRWPINKVFVFREQRAQAAADPYLQETLRLYQLIIVPHQLDEFALPLPAGVPVVWSGPIVGHERSAALPRQEAERQLGLPPLASEHLRLYINFGGGGDPDAVYLTRTALDAVAQVPALVPVLAIGPLARDDSRRDNDLDALPDSQRIQRYPLADCFAAFDVALSAAGYNSFHELLHHGVPTVFVPVSKSIDDQEARVRRAVQAGAALIALPDSPTSLIGALQRLCDPAERRGLAMAGPVLVPPGGAERAAQAILTIDKG